MFFDTHCHINSVQYEEDREDVLLRAKTEGVQVVEIATTLETAQTSLQLSKQYEHVYATAGLHPEEINPGSIETYDINGRVESLDSTLREQPNAPKIIAIGEIGLDYYWLRKSDFNRDEVDKAIDLQKKLYALQIALAEKFNKPAIIHTRAVDEEERNIVDDVLGILNQYPSVKAVFHSFTGSIENAKKFLDRGHFISFNGILTFKKAHDIRELFAFVHKNYPTQWFLETDGPYLAPDGKRGKRNEPAWVKDIYAFVDELTGEKCEERVEENVREFFELAINN